MNGIHPKNILSPTSFQIQKYRCKMGNIKMFDTISKLAMKPNLIPVRDYLLESYLIKYNAEISQKLDEASTKEEGEIVLINHTLDSLLLSRINTDIGLMFHVHDEILANKEIQEDTKNTVLGLYSELSSLDYNKEVELGGDPKQDAISTRPYSIAYYDYWIKYTQDSNPKIYECRAASLLKEQQKEGLFYIGKLMNWYRGYLPKNYDFSPNAGFIFLNRNIRKKDYSKECTRRASNDEIQVRLNISRSLILQSESFSHLKHLLLNENGNYLFDSSIFIISVHNWFSKFSIPEKTKILNSTFPFSVNENFVKTLFEKGTDGYQILDILTSSLYELKYFNESRYISEYLYKKNIDSINCICGSRYVLSSKIALSYKELEIFGISERDCNKSASDWFKQALEDYKLLNDDEKIRLVSHQLVVRIQFAETEYRINENHNQYTNILKKIYRESRKIPAPEDVKTILQYLIRSCRDTSNFDDETYYLKEYFKQNSGKYSNEDVDLLERFNYLSSLQNNKPNLQKYKCKLDLKKFDEEQSIDTRIGYCKHLLSENQYDRILTYLDYQLTQFPKNAKLLGIKAETLYLVNDLTGAVETYSQLLDSNSEIDKETKWNSLMGRAVVVTELSSTITDEIRADISSAFEVFDNLPNNNDDEIKELLSKHLCQIIEKIALWNNAEKEHLFAIEINEAYNRKFEKSGWQNQLIRIIADAFFDFLLLDEAEDWYTHYINVFQTSPDSNVVQVYVKLGEIEIKRGNWEKAQSHLNYACILDQNSLDVLLAQMKLCQIQRDYVRAMGYVDRCKNLYGDDDAIIKKEFEVIEEEVERLSKEYINYDAIKSRQAIDVLKSADTMMGELSPKSRISLYDYSAISNTYAKGVEILLRDTIVLNVYNKMEKMDTIFPVSDSQMKNYSYKNKVSPGYALKTLLSMKKGEKTKHKEDEGEDETITYETITLGQWDKLNNDFEMLKNFPEVEIVKKIFDDIGIDEDARKYIGEITESLSHDRNPGTHHALYSYKEVQVKRGTIVRQINNLNRYLGSRLCLNGEN